MSNTEARTRWTELVEARRNAQSANGERPQTPAGSEKRDSLILIGCFRERIAAMKWAEVDRGNTLQRTA